MQNIECYEDSKGLPGHQKLISLNYYYNSAGKLKPISTIKEEDYTVLAKATLELVQQILIYNYKMREVWLPLDFDNNGTEGSCNIFVSNKLLVLIQGSDPVRAGLWAENASIYNSLSIGSMIPYIKRGLAEGYSIIIFNPNLHICPVTKTPIKFSENMPAHCHYVWTRFISPSKCKRIFIAAHSAGGISVSFLLHFFLTDFMNRISCAVIMDGPIKPPRSEEEEAFLNKKTYFFNASEKPHGTVLEWGNRKILSAGSMIHEEVCGHAFNMIFDLFLLSR